MYAFFLKEKQNLITVVKMYDSGSNDVQKEEQENSHHFEIDMDPILLQEELSQSKYQNKKINALLQEIRAQLAITEEHNSSLQIDIENLSKRLREEQRINEFLRKERKENEESKENHNQLIRKYEELTRDLIHQKKQNVIITNDMIEFETENRKMSEMVRKFQNKQTKLVSENAELKKSISFRERECSSLEEENKILLNQCSEKDKTIQSLNDMILKLKTNIKTLEKQQFKEMFTLLKNKENETFPNLNKSKVDNHNPYDDPSDDIDFNPPASVLQNSMTSNSSDSIEDSYLLKTVMTQFLTNFQQECLKDELDNVSNADQNMPDTCDHVLKIIQCENEIKKLKIELTKRKVESDKIGGQKYDSLYEMVERCEDEFYELQGDLRLHINCSKQIEKYKKELTEAREEVKNLKTQINSKENQLDSKIVELNSKDQQIERIKDNDVLLDVSRNKIAELEQQIVDIRETKQVYEKEIEVLRHNANDRDNKILKFTFEISELKDACIKYEKKINYLNFHAEILDRAISFSHKKHENYVTLCTQLDTFLNELDKIKNINEILKDAVKELHTYRMAYGLIKCRVLKLEEKNITTVKKLNEHQNKCTEIMDECEKVLEEQKKSRIRNIKDSNKEISYLKEFLVSYQVNYKDTLKQISEVKDACKIWIDDKKKLSEIEEKYQDIKNTFSECLKENDNLKEMLKHIESENEKNKKHLQNVLLEKQNWEIQERNLSTEVDALAGELTELRRRLNNDRNDFINGICKNCSSKKCEIFELNVKLNNLESKLQATEFNAKSTIDTLEEQLRDEKNHNINLSTKFEAIVKEKCNLLENISDKEREIKILCNENEKNNSRINKLIQNIKSLEFKIRVTQQYLSSEICNRNQKIIECNSKLTEAREDSQKAKGDIKVFNVCIEHILADRRKILKTNIYNTIQVWKTTFDNILDDPEILDIIEDSILEDEEQTSLQSEVFHLDFQLQLTNLLLKAFIKIKNHLQPVMYPPIDEYNSSSDLAPPSSPKRKLVLKPATLIIKQNTKSCSMSPDDTSKMNEVSNHRSLKLPDSNRVEMNNNDLDSAVLAQLMHRTRLTDSITDVNEQNEIRDYQNNEHFSAHSSKTTSSESLSVDTSGNEYGAARNCSEGVTENEKDIPIKQFRSMSDSAATVSPTTADGDIIVFPSLQDNILETMGLLGDGQREILTEDEIENKFQKLALAFTIDALTLADRRDRQRRQRDQAEHNMSSEVTKLMKAIHRLNPLCIDAEKTELVSSLLGQLDVILQASSRISTAAEVFGSVQQEWRLAESVTLMQNHLRNLKQQRDMARKQLQCTKRILQDTTTVQPTNGVAVQSKSSFSSVSLNRRRASIATMSRTLDPCTKACINPENPRRLVRRISTSGELSPRYTDSRRPDWQERSDRVTLSRTTRHSRLELGLDLVKIKEGTVESTNEDPYVILETEIESNDTKITDSSYESVDDKSADEILTFRSRITKKVGNITDNIERKWNNIVEAGALHEFCCLGAIICFAMCTIMLENVMTELVNAKKESQMQHIPWTYMTWDEIIRPFLNLRHARPPPL